MNSILFPSSNILRNTENCSAISFKQGTRERQVIKVASFILAVLTDIVNHSLLTKVFPSAWKEFDLVPILKDGDHEIPNNNRRVSLLPALCQICERAALNQRTEYMIRGNCLNEHQNGNKKQHSTETLNIFKTDLTYKAMDRKQVTALVLLNLSKAFDNIEHGLLEVNFQIPA